LPATGSHHTHDSVEFFLNERFLNPDGEPWPPNTGIADKGGQYRVGVRGERSGDPGVAVDLFEALDKSDAWVEPGRVNAINPHNGQEVSVQVYHVIFQAPWRFTSREQIVDGMHVGIELQINACAGNGDRDGVVVWNNVAHSNYQRVESFGVGILDFDGKNLPANAEFPVITAQPVSRVYTLGDTVVLTVSATTTDGGTLSYEWFRSDTLTGDGISVGTGAVITPVFTTEGDFYFYAIVTNTVEDAQRSVKSNVAKISVYDGQISELLTLTNGAYAIYQFILPAGATWADYKEISAEYKVDADNLAKGQRFRLMGNYAGTIFSLSGGKRVAGLSNFNAPYIMHNRSGWAAMGNPTADTWFTVTYNIDGTGAGIDFNPSLARPTPTAVGPFYFGLGITGDAQTTSISQEIRNITLVSINGDKCVISYGSGFAEQAFVAWGAADGERELKITP
jgi:hypothetical protein